MIFFSIIIPTYNRANLIIETVDSVRAQTYPHFEVIIVDDGSTDKTGEIINEKYNKEEKIKYFLKQNEERGAARNYGLKQAKGDYAVFFDSDDWMQSHYLETLKCVIEQKPEIFLVAAKYNYINEERVENHADLLKLSEGWYDRHFFLKGNILACNYCIRIKDHKYKFFPEERELSSMEDWLFLLLNLESNSIFIIDKIVLTMRQHDERSMMNNQKVIEARQRALTWALQNISLSVSDEKALSAWSYYFCGIHEYLDGSRTRAIRAAGYAIKTIGINKKFLVLLIKGTIGRNLITKLK